MTAAATQVRELESLALRHLALGSDLEELRAAFAHARDAARDRAEVELIDEMLADAITLHEARSTGLRRERELAALVDTAVDLTDRRDLDEVLRALCQRVRSLLGTDAAYITLRDEERSDTFVRMTDGIVSDEFRSMRMPFGVGLGGLVAQSGTSEATDDYTTDERFVHTENIDRRVAIEGLRGIAGAPLRRGRDILGVVLTGTRYPRRFRPSEVALLESLATMAAIAIENARLFDEALRTCEELTRANEAVRAHTEWLERSSEAHDHLTRLTLEGGGVAELVPAIAGVLGGTVEWRAVDGEEPLTAAPPAAPAAGEGSQCVAVPVTVGDEQLGTLVLMRDAEITPNDRHFLERGALLVARVVLNERARAEVEQRLAGEVVEELCVGGPASLEPVTRRAAKLGASLCRDHVVVVAEPPASAVRWSRVRAQQAAADASGLAGTVDGLVVAVVPGTDAKAIADAWAGRLAGPDGERPTVGVAGPASGAAALREAYGEARRTHRLLVALDRRGSVATADDLGALGLLLSRSLPGELRAFVADRLEPIDRQARESATLLATLEAYFENGGHLARSARALHVHVNTLYRRLERIDELLGETWRSPERSLDLHLALRLRRLMARLDESAAA